MTELFFSAVMYLWDFSQHHYATAFPRGGHEASLTGPHSDYGAYHSHTSKLHHVGHRDMRLSSLTKGLEDILTGLKTSQDSSSALAGAVLGLRGSPAYTQIVRDTMHASKLLSESISDVASVQKMVHKAFSDKDLAESGVSHFPVPMFSLINCRNRVSTFL